MQFQKVAKKCTCKYENSSSRCTTSYYIALSNFTLKLQDSEMLYVFKINLSMIIFMNKTFVKNTWNTTSWFHSDWKLYKSCEIRAFDFKLDSDPDIDSHLSSFH